MNRAQSASRVLRTVDAMMVVWAKQMLGKILIERYDQFSGGGFTTRHNAGIINFACSIRRVQVKWRTSTKHGLLMNITRPLKSV